MKSSNNLTLALIGMAVKTYMIVGIVWSKSNEQYQKSKVYFQQDTSSKDETLSSDVI
jgi:hypothetical protein